MANTLKNNLVPLTVFVIAAWFYHKAQKGAAIIAKPVGSLLAELQFAVNGSNYIKYTAPGFFLNPDKLNPDNTVNDRLWLKAMYMAHEKHEQFIEQLFDPNLRLRPEYSVLIGQIVDEGSIATALKG
ncbi:hypothetical protein [Pseudoalteromonas xiamenensis]